MFHHITEHSGAQDRSDVAKKRSVHDALHIRSTVDYVRQGCKNNFD